MKTKAWVVFLCLFVAVKLITINNFKLQMERLVRGLRDSALKEFESYDDQLCALKSYDQC